MNDLSELATELADLQRKKKELEDKIAWANYACTAPKQFLTPTVQSFRLSVLESLEAKKQSVESKIKAIEFKFFEAKVLAERYEAKKNLAQFGLISSSK